VAVASVVAPDVSAVAVAMPVAGVAAAAVAAPDGVAPPGGVEAVAPAPVDVGDAAVAAAPLVAVVPEAAAVVGEAAAETGVPVATVAAPVDGAVGAVDGVLVATDAPVAGVAATALVVVGTGTCSMTPQAIRAPELPAGSVRSSSGPAWTTSALPLVPNSGAGGPAVAVGAGVVAVVGATATSGSTYWRAPVPLARTAMFGRSPACGP
jgi:hypothetical protein